MTTIPLRGIDFSGRILVPLHANGLLNEIQAVTNQRQKDSIVREIQKSIISIQHKLNVAFYQAVLIRSLKTDDYTLFELYPGRLSNSNVSHKICTYSMFNIDEYLLVLTFFIETFAATVFSLFDVSGSLINHLYQLNLKEEEVDFKTVIWELQKQSRIDPNDDVLRLLFSYYSWKKEPAYFGTTPLRDVTWMKPMKEVRNRTTHRPITDVCNFIRRGDIYSNLYQGVPETDFFLDRNISQNTRLFDFAKEVFEGIELFVEELYTYLSQATQRSGSLPIY